MKEIVRLNILKNRLQNREKLSDNEHKEFESLMVLYLKHSIQEQWELI
ncbi:MAG: hypothetical protein PHF84_07185 [bacterium]|nr:hypothetical protein [bacterium]